MHKLLISDIGDVVLSKARTLKKIADHLGMPFEELKEDYAQYNYPLQEGFVTAEAYLEHLNYKFCYKYNFNITTNLFMNFYTPEINTELIDYYRKAKERGLRIVVGSNSMECINQWYYDNCSSIFDVFDSVYYSNDIHHCKPNESFFEYIMRKEGFKPEETYFIDDREENIITANKMGIHSLFFSDNSQLEDFFSKI